MAAIKKIERAFEHPLFAKRTLRELKILRLLSHENVRLSILHSISNLFLGGKSEDNPESRNSGGVRRNVRSLPNPLATQSLNVWKPI